jgi:steroid delta-isomerase-like uncharacterized protein
MTELAPAAETERASKISGAGFSGPEMGRRRSAAHALIARFFEAFNAQDRDALMGLVSEDIVLDCHPQHREWGLEALEAVFSRGQNTFREHVFDIEIMTNVDGTRAAAEYTVLGVPVGDDGEELEEVPQSYRFSGGLFFEIRDARIGRLSPLRNVPRVAESLI